LAVDADTAEQLTGLADQADETQTDATSAGKIEPALLGAATSLRWPLIAGIVVLLGLSSLFGWLGYHAHETRQAEQQRDLFLAAGRQAALNLTTISADTADADVARILDSSIGTFHDDWTQRGPAFVQVVKKAQSKTVGSVTAAAVESVEFDKARVLVAVSVKTTTAGAPEEKPRAWRMRIDVQKVGDGTKVADVEFVP
jgi:Mce-associated membrane protein